MEVFIMTGQIPIDERVVESMWKEDDKLLYVITCKTVDWPFPGKRVYRLYVNNNGKLRYTGIKSRNPERVKELGGFKS
jgi:hypothetical protein